ncbi:lysylphosphatidylglycerol synthase transmembrane domain-containing protein [Chlorobium sp. N1]|uniref:lysylphosphatidylglycerol synthase transmembrane domain-containing protein n=1 Tax=Chlorobium sp. N1 TaxID=2491138 RepID=UPI00103A813B|nr:lysylphosphatidylglycerol synthase transmembrane domain-containing protein [Chlorobium sp. N1]TCD47634.1 flippase-like domain-containing protein [Chlorobium sp. N1]
MAKTSQGAKKTLKALLQVLVTLTALYLVLQKTDVRQIGQAIGGSNPWYILLAIVFFNISKLFNAVRLNRFFRAIGLDLPWGYNLKLYYLGMFYNLFLPGGVGGDGYKIFVLQKNHGVKTINVFHAVFWDRLTGIIALIFLALILLIPSSFAALMPTTVPYLWAGLAAVYPMAWLLNRFAYPQFLQLFAVTAWESIMVQATQAATAFFILQALSPDTHSIDYLAIFMFSTVATILPITIGGAGAREVTFYYMLNHIQLDASLGIALSLVFFAVSAVSSLPGILLRIRHEAPAAKEAETP